MLSVFKFADIAKGSAGILLQKVIKKQPCFVYETFLNKKTEKQKVNASTCVTRADEWFQLQSGNDRKLESKHI